MRRRRAVPGNGKGTFAPGIATFRWDIRVMKRFTVTLPDELAQAIENYQTSYDAPPALTAVVQAARRQYSGERGFLKVRRSLYISPAEKGNGRQNVNCAHD